MEEALRRSEEQYRMLVAQASDAIVVTDREGRYLDVNDRACELLGYTREDLLRLTYPETVDLADLAARPIPFDELRAARVARTERWLRRKDGSPMPVEMSARMLPDGRLQAIWRDVTERRRAQEALRAYAERLRVLHAIDQGILAAESPGEIAANALRQLRPLLAARRATLVLIEPETGETVLLAVDVEGDTRLPAGTRTEAGTTGYDLELLRQGGVQVVEDVSVLRDVPRAQALHGEGVRSYTRIPLITGGRLIGTLNFGLEATGSPPPERVEAAREVAGSLAVALEQARLRGDLARHARELERRVAERTAELEETNAELEAFSYSVSHDLRAPLRAVQGLAQALLEDYGDRLDATGREYASRLAAAAERMDALIQDLLEYSRLSRAAVTLEPVALGGLLAELLASLDAEIRARDARVTVEAPLPAVRAHRPTLPQVLTNLLTNALKFVRLGVPPEVRVWAGPAGGHVRLWVADRGIGVAPEHQARIFRVFERLHGLGTYPGTGIGLAIVQKGVAHMGGRCGVESEPGQGSRFWIDLARAEGEP